MLDGQLLLILIVAAALLYDFVNGFHDAANAIATTVATRALSPRHAIILARTLNFFGALFHTAVAYTIGKGVVEAHILTLPVILAALCGAIAWGFLTWYFGLPSSSTHALIGGMAGVALMVSGFDTGVLIQSGVQKIIIAMILSPLFGFAAGLVLTVILAWSVRRSSFRKTNTAFKKVQIASAMFMAYSHGMNDAQNAMGIITIALVSSGAISAFHVPLWVRVASALAMGIGTSVGGWRIIRTMGHKMAHLEPIDGCSAETSAGAVITIASTFGAPISTTHVISTSIMGSAAAHRIGNVNWRVVGNIVLTWVLTFPGAALCGCLAYLLISLFV